MRAAPRKGIQMGLVLTAAVALTLMLAGCDEHLAEGPVAIRKDGEALLVAVCAAIAPDFISMEERAPDDVWVRFWETSSELQLDEGSILSTDDRAVGIAGDVTNSPHLLPRSDVSILIKETDRKSSIHGVFLLGDAGLSESQWLQTDGSLTSEPCES